MSHIMASKALRFTISKKVTFFWWLAQSNLHAEKYGPDSAFPMISPHFIKTKGVRNGEGVHKIATFYIEAKQK